MLILGSHTNLYEVFSGEERKAYVLHQMRHMFLSHVLIMFDPRDDCLKHLHTHTNSLLV